MKPYNTLNNKEKVAYHCHIIVDELSVTRDDIELWNDKDNDVYDLLSEIDSVLESAKKIANKYDIAEEEESQIIRKDNTLYINDTVMWSGGFGNDPYKPAKVLGIQYCEVDEKYGEEVQDINWNDVKDHAVVDLDNGHWAYGSQLKKMEDK